MGLNAQSKNKGNTPGSLKTVQTSMGISSGKRSATGTGRQTIQESLSLGNKGPRRKLVNFGKSHLRDSMEL